LNYGSLGISILTDFTGKIFISTSNIPIRTAFVNILEKKKSPKSDA